jgi:hypothetical protein
MNYTFTPEALAAQRKADRKRVRAELRDRIDHCREVGVDFEDVLRWIANENPDLVTEALDEAGAPS